MLRTLVRRASHAPRQPLMKFPDRKAAHGAHEPHPHPAAPKEVTDNFSHFQEQLSSGPHFDKSKVKSPADILNEIEAKGQGAREASKGSGAAKDAVEDVRDLPPRFWKTPSLAFSEEELEAVMSGGASLLK